MPEQDKRAYDKLVLAALKKSSKARADARKDKQDKVKDTRSKEERRLARAAKEVSIQIQQLNSGRSVECFAYSRRRY